MALSLIARLPKWLVHITSILRESKIGDNESIYLDALASRGAAAAANAGGRRDITGSKTINIPVDQSDDWKVWQAYYGNNEATVETTTPQPQTIATSTSPDGHFLETCWTILKHTFFGSLVLVALLAVVVFFYHTRVIYQEELDDEKEQRRKQSSCLPKYADWSDAQVRDLLANLSETVDADDYIPDDDIEDELDDLIQEQDGRTAIAKKLKTTYSCVFFNTLTDGFSTSLRSPLYPFRVIHHYVSDGFGIDAWTLDRWINASIAWLAEKLLKAIIFLFQLPFVLLLIPLLHLFFALLATLYHRLSPSQARRNAWNDRLEAFKYHPYWRIPDDCLQRLNNILADLAGFLWYLPIVIFAAGLLIPVYRGLFPAVATTDGDYQWVLPMWAEVARIKQFGFLDDATPMDWDRVVSAVRPREPLESQEAVSAPRSTKTVSKWAPETTTTTTTATTTITVSLEADTVTETTIQSFTQSVVETTTATVTASREVPALEKLGHRVMDDWGFVADGRVTKMGEDWKGYCRGCKQWHCCEHHG